MEYFEREEEKYFLTKEKYDTVLNLLKEYIVPDRYSNENVCSLYFDSKNKDLAIKSLDKPNFREKIRLRSYSKVTGEDEVFLEMKKKLDGITYKKRIVIKLKDFWNYYNNGIIPSYCDRLTMNEIDYYFKTYELIPTLFIYSNRKSYLDKNNNDIRITFDYNIKYKDIDKNMDANENLFNMDSLKRITDDDIYVMEIKSLSRMPLWLNNILSENKLYPVDFSKFREAYIKALE